MESMTAIDTADVFRVLKPLFIQFHVSDSWYVCSVCCVDGAVRIPCWMKSLRQAVCFKVFSFWLARFQVPRGGFIKIQLQLDVTLTSSSEPSSPRWLGLLGSEEVTNLWNACKCVPFDMAYLRSLESLTLRRLMSYIYIYIYIWSTHSWCF